MEIKNQPNANEEKLSLWDADEALQRLAGNHELLNTIATMFVAQIALKATALREAVTSHDVEAVRFISHTIKGSSGDIGATALHNLAAKIELLAKANELTLVADNMTAFDQTITATITSIQRELPNLGSAP